MATIRPFKALRPHNEYAVQVAARPYDVLSSDEARKEAEGNLLSFLHVTKAEIDLAPDVDVHTPAVYEMAARNLQHLQEKHILFQEEKPCYYIYELGWQGRIQTGLVCVSSIEDYFSDIIKKHEFTRPEKEQDRVDHMLTIRAQTGNVFMACKDIPELDDIFDHWKKQHNAEYHFTAPDGVAHAVWVIDTAATIDIITNLFAEKVPFTYIADGHHRAASAGRVSKSLQDSSDAQFFLTTIFPAHHLSIMDYNRVAKDLNGLDEEAFLQRVRAFFDVETAPAAFSPARLHEFGMFLGNQWYKLTARLGLFDTDPVGVLDVSILQKNILDKILGIQDPRTDNRVDFVGGIRGLAELEKKVTGGEAKVAFSLHPVGISQLFAIADSGGVMPPKSTWFEPKLRDGLLTHLI
jgi:uncharacterized protein (DUF1015 family)